MRLGIRRKLIGTLMLVGLLPLALSLAVILGGGAVLRLHSIRARYDHDASMTARGIEHVLLEEVKDLTLLARLPQVINYARDQTAGHAGRHPAGPVPPTTQADSYSADLDRKWAKLQPSDDPVREIMHNPLADRLGMLAEVDAHGRELLATDAYGELIAATAHTADYFQADDAWWQTAFSGGQGRPYISSVTPNQATGELCVEIVVPIYEDGPAPRRIIGVIKDKLDLGFLREQLAAVREGPGRATAQVLDLGLRRTVFSSPDIDQYRGDEGVVRKAAEDYLRDGGDAAQRGLLGVALGDLVIGAQTVELAAPLAERFPGAVVPQWVVIVSKPAAEAMTSLYRLALMVAGIGIALILVLFGVGVVIANREIIMPILRLREATAAVGRGELNIRLMPGEGGGGDPTFRMDELGELAHDFDEMTRQLQKNVGQLARSNEAKRRFMELAGHELRTPVTYIVGVCQLSQRQVQAGAGEEPAASGPETATLARSATIAAALAKIAAKAQRLSRIIENLLKLVNNDQFTTRLVKTPVDMRALILQVCNDARPFVNERKQQLVVDVAENLPAIEGDRDKLEDALTNLLSNAIRFSPDNSPVKVAARVVVGDMLEILVEDSGPGIPQADLANLFEPFYTGSDLLHHHSGTIEYGSKGIGLGLAIVRRFVEIHGGVVRANSTGHGTVFQILLPLSPTQEIGGEGVGAK